MLNACARVMVMLHVSTCAPNTTSLIQPMDQGILENIKRLYERDLLLCLLQEENESFNMATFTKTLNILDAVLMCAKSWSEVKESTIAKSWSKILFQPTLHQDDDPETSDELDDIMEQLSVPQERDLIGLAKMTPVIVSTQTRK